MRRFLCCEGTLAEVWVSSEGERAHEVDKLYVIDRNLGCFSLGLSSGDDVAEL